MLENRPVAKSSLPASLSSTPNIIVNTTSAFPGANGKIAFESYRDGNAEIYVMNADGSGQTNLTNNLGNERFLDGSKIAFSSDRDGNHEIYVMNADGSGVTRLTFDSATDVRPDWQPLSSEVTICTSQALELRRLW